MIARFLLAALASLALLAGVGALAATLLPAPPRYYHTSYMRLAIPEAWTCGAQGTEHVCALAEGPRRALIVLTAKERGPNDTLDFYRSHLRDSEGRQDGRANPTAPGLVQDRRIGDQLWVVAALDESLLPGYRSHYYATVAGNIAVLVTFSVSLSLGDAHDGDLDRLLESLRLYRRPDGAGIDTAEGP